MEAITSKRLMSVWVRKDSFGENISQVLSDGMRSARNVMYRILISKEIDRKPALFFGAGPADLIYETLKSFNAAANKSGCRCGYRSSRYHFFHSDFGVLAGNLVRSIRIIIDGSMVNQRTGFIK